MVKAFDSFGVLSSQWKLDKMSFVASRVQLHLEWILKSDWRVFEISHRLTPDLLPILIKSRLLSLPTFYSQVLSHDRFYIQ